MPHVLPTWGRGDAYVFDHVQAQFDILRVKLIKVAARATEMVTRIKVSLPTAFAHQRDFALLAAALAPRPP
jgi:hypothetical protein